MTALNGLTRPWDSFIQTMCARKESMKFDIVWEDCIQEEAIVANIEALLKEDDKALATHTRRGRRQSSFKKDSHKEYQPPKRFQKKRENTEKKNYSQYQCYNCQKIGHLVRDSIEEEEEHKTSCTSS